jgi:polyhydroxybutyrate depolymerase
MALLRENYDLICVHIRERKVGLIMAKSCSKWSIGIASIFCLLGIGFGVAQAGTISRSLKVAGQVRHFTVTLPDGAKRRGPVSTVIALHGPSMTGRTMRRIFGLDELAERDGFAVAYPDGLQWRWNDGRLEEGGGPDDVAFIRRLADSLVRERIADRERLYLLGISNGGMLAYRVACEAPSTFAAYAAILANLPVGVAWRCVGHGSSPMLIINATDDPVIPWEGGELHSIVRSGQVLSTPDTVEFWKRENGCTADAELKAFPDKDVNDGSTVVARQYSNCTSGAPVVFMTVQGGGHMPPGARIGKRPALRVMLGPLNQDISAADISLKFFKRFPPQR